MPAVDPQIIQQIVAPAVMIPACGLLLLSSTARMNTVLARIRAFHAERLDVWRSDAEAGSKSDQVRALRLEGLEHQTHRMLRRAALLRVTMMLLFGAIACNLLAVIGLALRFVIDEPDGLYNGAVGVFIAGIALMLGAMVTSAVEVGRILETVVYEHGRVERLCGAPASTASNNDPAPAPRRTEPQGSQL